MDVDATADGMNDWPDGSLLTSARGGSIRRIEIYDPDQTALGFGLCNDPFRVLHERGNVNGQLQMADGLRL